MQLLRLISWPYARKHLLRYALSVVGIALGIGIAVALQGGTQTVLSDFRQTVDQIAGSCQLQVAAGEAGVPEAFIEKLQALPQVRAASPVIEALAETDVAATRLLIVGLDITGDAAMRPWLFRTGEGSAEIDPIAFIAQPDSLLMTRSFAAGHGWAIGSKLGLHTMDGLKAFTVRGLLSDENLEKIYGGNVAVMDVYGAQRVFGRGSSVDRIEIALTEGTSLEDGRAAIRRAVGPGYTVEPPSARGEQFEDLVKAYETLEAMACLFAVALGICMIDASFRLAVAQRRMEIGILRSLGATRGQIQSLFMWEGLITGALGSTLGLALGIHLFAAGTRMAGTMFRGSFGGLADQTQQVHVSPLVIAVAFLAGIGISLVASWLPARDAARANPVEAFRPMYYQRSLTGWQPRALLWSGLLALGALAGGTQEGSTAAFYTSMVLLFLAVVLAIPTFVLGAVHVLRPLLGRVRVPGLDKHANEFLAEQWIAGRPLDDRRSGQRAYVLDPKESSHQRLRVGRVQRFEHDERGVRPARRPRRVALEQLGTSHADEQERHGDGWIRHLPKHVEGDRVRPLQVVDDHDEWATRRDRLEVLADAPAELHGDPLGRDVGQRRGWCFETQEHRDASLDRGEPVALRHERAQAVAELGEGRGAVIRRPDPGVFADDVHERPVGDTRAIRQTTATKDAHVRAPCDSRHTFADEPRLPDSRVPDDGDQIAGALILRTFEGLEQLPQLARPSDEGGIERVSPTMRGRARAVGTERAEGDQGLDLALRDDRFPRLVLDRVAGQSRGERADHDFAGLRSLLQSGGDVDRVACHEELTVIAHTGDHLAAVDADAERERDSRVVIEVGDRITHRERRPDRPFSVVLVQLGDAEHDHDRVPDELLDRATVRLGDVLHAREVARHHGANEFGIVARAHRRGIDDVREEEADELALLAHAMKGARHGMTTADREPCGRRSAASMVPPDPPPTVVRNVTSMNAFNLPLLPASVETGRTVSTRAGGPDSRPPRSPCRLALSGRAVWGEGQQRRCSQAHASSGRSRSRTGSRG